MTRVVADDQALAEKKRRRESLQATHDALDDLDPCLSLWDLGALNILRLPMTLEDNDGPIFFKPYPARIENPPNGDSAYSNDGNLAVWLAHYFLHCSLPGDGPPNISYLDQQQLKSRALSNLAPGFQWEVHLLLRIRRNSEPHAVAILSSEMKKESNDDLYRGEIQAIVRIMQRRLKRRCREPNVMAPVRVPICCYCSSVDKD
ncbi:hypothetical protein BJY04DRAFT_113038 [Aspergillus karnatakaensis]|uniref:uncharacterized protein n=1 Tax=Aspergillus karnatakaensis TaxID=1810916 RepID=UPI003CCE288F